MLSRQQPTRVTSPAHAPKAKPDPRPMRLALIGGGIAALSALATAIVLPPQSTPPTTVDAGQQAADPMATAVKVDRQVKYVQLAPGQTAPPGSKVIDASAPTPHTVVVTITAPPAKATKRPVVRTTQSGRVIP